MSNKSFTLIALILFCLIFSCKKSTTPDPVKPEETKINKTLLTGWWAPVEKNNARIYFGNDNFFYQDTITKAGEKNVSAPITGFWSLSGNDIKYKQTPAGTDLKAFTVESLIAGKLIVKAGNTTISYSKGDLPAITSPSITTIAGNGTIGYSGDGGLAVNASLSGDVRGMVIDKAGNLYFCDYTNNVVRKITTDGKISTVIGTGKKYEYGIEHKSYIDGSNATSADILSPLDLAFDTDGNLYVSEDVSDYGRIDKITPDGKIYLVAGSKNPPSKDIGDGGLATKATLSEPAGLAFDKQGNLYVADIRNYRIRKISSKTKTITTIAGNGNGEVVSPIENALATSTEIQPIFLSIDANDNIYYTDITRIGIRKITASTGKITTITNSSIKNSANSGDGGLISNAYAGWPWGLCQANNGDIYFISDFTSLRKISNATNIVTKVAGNGYSGYIGEGPHATAYSLQEAYQVALDNNGNAYVSQPGRISKISVK